MAVKDWSTTASNNTAPGSVNFQESQLPSTLNNSMRQVLADMRTHFENGGWIQLHTTVFASSTTFTVASVDVRTTYAVGRRVRAVGSSTGTIYGVITVTAFSSNTTVTVVWDSGNLSSETLAISVSTQDQNGHVDAAMILSGTLNNNRLDADIKAIANLTSAADKLPYFTGSGSADVATFTAAGRALLDDANASAQLTTLGALPLAGGTMTGDLVLDGAPDADLKAATKAYVDNVAGSATDAAASAVTAANFAVKVNGAAAGSDFSAKAHAIGGTGVTDATGSAKEWATEVEDNTVAGSNTFSALHHSAKAAAQATAAASSASTASGHATTAQAAAQGWGAVTTITGATTNLEVADARDYYILDASSNTVTINLPAIGSSDGLLFGFQVHNVDNAISIVRDGSDRINGSAGNYAGLVAVGQVINFIADDATPDNWLATIISQSSAATATSAGVVELATNAESIAGTDAARAVTPASLHAKTASATVIGLVELATDAEAVTGSDTARALTPANLAAVREENVVLSEAKSVNISTPLLGTTDHTFTGLSAQMLAGGAIAAFKLVCIHTTTSEVVTADASAYATARVLGIAPAAIGDTATGTVLLQGFIRDDTFNFTTGSTLYLSETAGAMTHTAPTTDGAFVNIVGVALSPDVVYINPSMDVIEHA